MADHRHLRAVHPQRDPLTGEVEADVDLGAGRGLESPQARHLRKRGFTAQHSAVRTTGARRRADRPVEDRRARLRHSAVNVLL